MIEHDATTIERKIDEVMSLIVSSFPEKKYKKAKEEFYGDIGFAVNQGYRWRMFALLILGVLFLSVLSNVYFANKSTVVQYRIEVDRATGEVFGVKKLQDQGEYTVSEASNKRQIKDFIEYIRTVSTDEVVVRSNWDKTIFMVTKRGRSCLGQFKDEFKPKEKLGKVAVAVSDIVITKITDKSYQVNFTEEQFKILPDANVSLGKEDYTGTFTLVHIPPKTTEEIENNPLGIKIDEFHFTSK